MAAAAVVVTITAMTTVASPLALSSLHRTLPALYLNQKTSLHVLSLRHRAIPLVVRSSSTSCTTEFDISFGDSTSKKSTTEISKHSSPATPSQQAPPMLIPWIVRDENGNLTLSATPPATFLQSMVEEKTTRSKKGKGKDVKSKKAIGTVAASSSPPKYSKAARRFYNQNFREPQRLSKALAEAGVASRRRSEELIFEGKVTVNGSVCKLPQTQVDLLKDSIYVNGNRLPKKLPPKLYFAVNKPKGYICSNGKETKCVVSLFEEYWKTWNKLFVGLPKPRLFTVGRLDVATTGLIIVTNDGEFAQQLSHPSSNLTKEYIATVEGSVHKRHLIAMSEGTEIDGVHCTPVSVELLPSQPDMARARLRIVVSEGRNHEVRELVANAGLQIHSLKRVRIGGYRLPSDLGLGKYVELKQTELKVFGIKES